MAFGEIPGEGGGGGGGGGGDPWGGLFPAPWGKQIDKTFGNLTGSISGDIKHGVHSIVHGIFHPLELALPDESRRTAPVYGLAVHPELQNYFRLNGDGQAEATPAFFRKVAEDVENEQSA